MNTAEWQGRTCESRATKELCSMNVSDGVHLRLALEASRNNQFAGHQVILPVQLYGLDACK
jgi:hypothetical protein